MTTEPDFGLAYRDQPHLRERFIAELAARQHGVVAAWQLREWGFDKRAINRRVRAGRLHPIHRGVYAVGHARITGNGRWMAAALAHGPLAALSHRTAAAVHGVLRSSSPTAHVTVPSNGRRRRNGIVLHQVALPDDERTVVDGLPVTTIARTFLDLAADKDPLLDRAIEAAEHARVLDLGAIDLATPRPGVRRLRRALAIYRPGPAWTRSGYERRVIEAIAADGLPIPSVNVWVLGAERDLVWFDHKFVAELDGGSWHESTAAKIRDPQRDAALQLNDWKVLRVPQHWFDTDPAGVIATIRAYLVSRGERTPARPGR